MSRYYPRSIPNILVSLSLSFFLLVTMMFTFMPVAFAASFQSQHSSLLFQEDIERAGVSVVRLVVTYSSGTTPGGQLPTSPHGSKTTANTATLFSERPASGNSVTCTGLGFIVASWTNTGTPTSLPTPLATATIAASNNTWIMTDASLVNKSGGIPAAAACSNSNTQNKSTLTLSSITAYLSASYNSTPVSLTIPTTSILCGMTNTATCTTGPVLIGFSDSHLYPYLDVSQMDTPNTPVTGVALSSSTSTLTLPTASTVITVPPQEFITPYKVTAGTLPNPQPDTKASTQFGMPLIDAQGMIQGMYQSTPSGPAGSLPQPLLNGQIQTMLTNKNIVSNGNGHQNILEQNWNNAITEIAQGTSSQAHNTLLTVQQENPQFTEINKLLPLTTTSNTSGNGNTTTQSTPPGTQPGGIQLPVVGVVPYLLFIIIVLGIIFLLILIVLLSTMFRRGRKHHISTIAKQRSQPLHGDEVPPPTTQSTPPIPFVQQMPMPQLPQELSPALRPVHNSTSGTVMPSVPTAPIASAMSMPDAYKASLANQPTLVNFNQSSPANGPIDQDATVPLMKPEQTQQAATIQSAKELGFEIITNTDPGLKRMHKPNEDSIFAIHGVRNVNGMLQQVGLFIVADGMGGHADGKVASTLAIQTIINYVLPPLVNHREPLDNPAQLLAEGVQNANNAVHQHNMENHGDMGTTVTSTMLIGTTAYVANVGDSRTYLYRYPNGLNKVTRDHSVVASLVDAGIIKEDDIYTHTKRNQIYRSLGEKPYVEVDTFVEQLQSGDKLLLCSDGMWEMVRDPKIRAILEEPTATPQELGDRLIRAALEGGGEDNVSIIVVNVLESPHYEMKVGLHPIYQQEEVRLPSIA